MMDVEPTDQRGRMTNEIGQNGQTSFGANGPICNTLLRYKLG